MGKEKIIWCHKCAAEKNAFGGTSIRSKDVGMRNICGDCLKKTKKGKAVKAQDIEIEKDTRKWSYAACEYLSCNNIDFVTERNGRNICHECAEKIEDMKAVNRTALAMQKKIAMVNRYEHIRTCFEELRARHE